jgi:uncharacterized alkaline shock family protein YloU
MTTVMTPPATEQPGRTTIAERVVERIATRLLTELDVVGGSARRVLGIAVAAEDLDGDARVTAEVDETTARLAVRLSVAYPTSVRRAAEAARTYLMTRVEALTGLVVAAVDITVTTLSSPDATVRRVE